MRRFYRILSPPSREKVECPLLCLLCFCAFCHPSPCEANHPTSVVKTRWTRTLAHDTRLRSFFVTNAKYAKHNGKCRLQALHRRSLQQAEYNSQVDVVFSPAVPILSAERPSRTAVFAFQPIVRLPSSERTKTHAFFVFPLH